jgi:hypothetical protein
MNVGTAEHHQKEHQMSTTTTHREAMNVDQAQHLMDRRTTRAAFKQDDSDENFAAMKLAERVVRQDRRAKRNAKALAEVAIQEEAAKKAKKNAATAKAKATREAKKNAAKVVEAAEEVIAEGPQTEAETIQEAA